MTSTAKKIIRLSSYVVLVSIGAFLAIFPFLKKEAEYTTMYAPGIPDVQADVTTAEPQSQGDDDDDGSL